MAQSRKAESEQKRAWIGFRGTDAQRREIERKAALLNLSLSEYIRRCAVQGTVRIVQEGPLGAKLQFEDISNLLNKKHRTSQIPCRLRLFREIISRICFENRNSLILC